MFTHHRALHIPVLLLALCLVIAPATGQDELLSFSAADCDYGGNLKSVEALDSLTVQVTLCNPDAIFDQEMASLGLSVHPREWLDATGGTGDILTQAIGTGPLKLVNWDQGNEIVFERYEDHVNFHPMIENPGAPHMQNLIYKTISEGPARMAALRTGEVTFAEPSLQDAAEMKDDPEYIVYTSPHSGQQAYIAFAHKIPPFDDPRARRAVGYAVDRNTFANIAFEGLVEATHCPIAPGLFGEDQEKCAEWGTSYDPDQAKALLAELGYGPDNPLKVIMSVSTLQGWDESHIIMQQQLAEVGIEAEMEVRQFAAWVDHMSVVNDNTEGTPVVWTMGMSGMDPDYLVFLWQRPGYANQGIEDPVLDQMLRDQRALQGEARRAKLLEIQQFLLENGYEIPTWSPGWFWLQASKSNVKGFRQTHMVTPIFNDVTIED